MRLIAEVILRVFLTAAMRLRVSLRLAMADPSALDLLASRILEVELLERLDRALEIGVDLGEVGLGGRAGDELEQVGAVVLQPGVQLDLERPDLRDLELVEVAPGAGEDADDLQRDVQRHVLVL